MTIQRRPWLSLAGGYVLAFAVAVVAIGCGGSDLSQLRPGQCISGEPYFYPPDIEVIDCSEADPATDSMIVFAERATGGLLPREPRRDERPPRGRGGFFLEPSRETWDDGDRVGLCLTSALMGSTG